MTQPIVYTGKDSRYLSARITIWLYNIVLSIRVEILSATCTAGTVQTSNRRLPGHLGVVYKAGPFGGAGRGVTRRHILQTFDDGRLSATVLGIQE